LHAKEKPGKDANRSPPNARPDCDTVKGGLTNRCVMKSLSGMIFVGALVLVGLPLAGQFARGEKLNVCESPLVSWLDSFLDSFGCKQWGNQKEIERNAKFNTLPLGVGVGKKFDLELADPFPDLKSHDPLAYDPLEGLLGGRKIEPKKGPSGLLIEQYSDRPLSLEDIGKNSLSLPSAVPEREPPGSKQMNPIFRRSFEQSDDKTLDK
jgi:hypothetical protein